MMCDEEPATDPSRDAPREGFFDHRVHFHNSQGVESSPIECVVPIGIYEPTIDLFQSFATGVFISEKGLVCTARHVFQFEPQFFESMPHLTDAAFPAIYQYLPDHTHTIRAVLAAHPHPKFDLAVAVCAPLRHLPTDMPFDNMMQALTDEQLPIGTKVHQYS